MHSEARKKTTGQIETTETTNYTEIEEKEEKLLSYITINVNVQNDSL